ncbi:NUDIX hydrolase, partial [Aphanothece microscopica]|uniref:NUDIX hydrolase n=1 Tax=Aphanothece microscopica TaxID=1049561 RepID=UPI00398510BD
MSEPPWLSWAREILAIAQIGSTYSKDPYDLERYRALDEIGRRILATQAGMPMHEVVDALRHEKGYPTPKIEVRAAVFSPDGEILMVRERMDSDRWTLPGGWADVDRTPSEAIVHEVAEEAGYEIEVEKLAAVWDRRRQGYPVGLFSCYTM